MYNNFISLSVCLSVCLSVTLSGVPAVVDFAAMRDAMKKLSGDPSRINPVCPADLVIDHSVQVDFHRSKDALQKNQSIEFERNKERFQFLKVINLPHTWNLFIIILFSLVGGQ